jgi:copper(I)-binding protein
MTTQPQNNLVVFKCLAFALGLYLVSAAAMAQASSLGIVTPWARASVGQTQNSAVYLTIVSPISDRLTAASSPVAKVVELHMTSMEGETQPIATIDLPAGRPVSLQPRGLHILLVGLAQPLREGQSFALTLFFEKAGKRDINVVVEKPGATAPGGDAPAQMPMSTHHH